MFRNGLQRLKGTRAACAGPCPGGSPGRGTVGLEHRVGSSSVALVASWRTGQGGDAPWHPGEAFARMWGGVTGMEGGFSLLKLEKACGVHCSEGFPFISFSMLSLRWLFKVGSLGWLWGASESQTGMCPSAVGRGRGTRILQEKLEY